MTKGMTEAELLARINAFGKKPGALSKDDLRELQELRAQLPPRPPQLSEHERLELAPPRPDRYLTLGEMAALTPPATERMFPRRIDPEGEPDRFVVVSDRSDFPVEVTTPFDGGHGSPRRKYLSQLDDLSNAQFHFRGSASQFPDFYKVGEGDIFLATDAFVEVVERLDPQAFHKTRVTLHTKTKPMEVWAGLGRRHMEVVDTDRTHVAVRQYMIHPTYTPPARIFFIDGMRIKAFEPEVHVLQDNRLHRIFLSRELARRLLCENMQDIGFQSTAKQQLGSIIRDTDLLEEVCDAG